ncbi:30S ribosomal protein S6 [Candidatus Parcubacteria bacterium]|nr:MAG: 30S ribosomal protein S6 [Candidatus Parcubacteria bacterium]
MHYELSFIIGPNVPETEHKAVEKEILDNLKKLDAKITKEPYAIGRKKLAYPIKKQKHGFYVFLEFETEETAGFKNFDVKLKHNANILRYLLIKKTAASLKEVKPRMTTEAKTRSASETKPSFRKIGDSKSKPEVKDVKLDEKKEEIKVDLGDIDRQLDQILDKDL